MRCKAVFSSIADFIIPCVKYTLVFGNVILINVFPGNDGRMIDVGPIPMGSNINWKLAEILS